jgi:uncharacterized membrane protein YhaH (DUF805 family)
MSFIEAIQSGFRNYVNFTGRAFRSEYWYWVLFAVLASLVGEIIDAALFPGSFSTGATPVSSLVSLALILPGLGVAARRLHDIDRSGWWLLIGLIPIVGIIILIVWWCRPGTAGPNRFGQDPLGGHA